MVLPSAGPFSGRKMKKWATLILAYPVIFVLALILIGPTIPIDVSVLVISSIIAAIGLSRTDNPLFQVRPILAGWRSGLLARIRGRMP